MRKLLLALLLLAGVAALPAPMRAAPVARGAHPDALASTMATTDAATETVPYYRDGYRYDRRAEWRCRHGCHH